MITVLLSILVVVAVTQICVWIQRGDWSAAIIGSTFTLCYSLDLLLISVRQEIFVAQYLGLTAVRTADVARGAYVCIACWLLFSVLNRATSGIVRRRPFSVARRSPRTAAYVITTLALSVIVAVTISRAGLTKTVSARQDVFGNSLPAIVGFYALPALAVIGAERALRYRGIQRLVYALVVLAALAVLAASGSRNGFLVSALLPIVCLLWKHAGGAMSHIGRLAVRLVIAVVILAAPVVSTTWYLRRFRDVQTSISFTEGPDLSQADVLVGLMSLDPAPRVSTYVGAISWFVPRSLWADKPVGANGQVSLALTPERYELTGVETTSGLLGEAVLNFGGLGIISAAVLLTCMVLAVRLLMQSSDPAVWALGLVVLSRGVTVVRGDIVSVVAPVTIAIVLWFCIFGGRRARRHEVRRAHLGPGARRPVTAGAQ